MAAFQVMVETTSGYGRNNEREDIVKDFFCRDANNSIEKYLKQ